MHFALVQMNKEHPTSSSESPPCSLPIKCLPTLEGTDPMPAFLLSSPFSQNISHSFLLHHTSVGSVSTKCLKVPISHSHYSIWGKRQFLTPSARVFPASTSQHTHPLPCTRSALNHVCCTGVNSSEQKTRLKGLHFRLWSLCGSASASGWGRRTGNAGLVLPSAVYTIRAKTLWRGNALAQETYLLRGQHCLETKTPSPRSTLTELSTQEIACVWGTHESSSLKAMT